MYFISSNDNTQIAVYDLNSTKEKNIVLVHGWPLSHKMFEYQIPALLKEDYRIVLFDIRGFGSSEQTASGYTYAQFATDLYCVIYCLNLTNFALLGFSMGGAIVTKYMSLYQGYGVTKLCLLDAAVPSYCKTAKNPYGQSVEDTNQLINLGYQDRPALNQYFGSIFFAKQHSEPFKNWLQTVTNSASGTGEMNSLISLRDEDVFDDLKKIHVPTAIFHGKEDKICPFPMAEIMASTIHGSVLYPFEDAGHGTFYDAKDEFNKTLIHFLK